MLQRQQFQLRTQLEMVENVYLKMRLKQGYNSFRMHHFIKTVEAGGTIIVKTKRLVYG